MVTRRLGSHFGLHPGLRTMVTNDCGRFPVLVPLFPLQLQIQEGRGSICHIIICIPVPVYGLNGSGALMRG